MDCQSLQSAIGILTPTCIEPEDTASKVVDYSKPCMWICDKVRMVKAYTLLDSRCKNVLALPPEFRQGLIRESGTTALTGKSQKRSWMTSAYRSRKVDICDARQWQDTMDTLEAVKKNHRQYQQQLAEEPVMYPMNPGIDFKYRIIRKDPDISLDYLVSEKRLRHLQLEHREDAIAIPEQPVIEKSARKKPRPHQMIELVCTDPRPEEEFGTLLVKLPDTRSVENDQKVLLLFDRHISLLDEMDDRHISLLDEMDDTEYTQEQTAGKKNKSKKVSKNPVTIASNIQLKPIGSQRSQKVDPIMLRPQEWALYTLRQNHWDLDFCLVRRGEELIPNPLVLESGPLTVSQDDKMRVHDNDGEYYLNQEILTTLYEKRCSEAEACNKPVLPWFHYTSKPPYILPVPTSEARYHFFMERHNSAHTIGVYVNNDTEDGDVHVYLHETEGAEESTSVRIREQVKQMMTRLYPDKKICLFFPEPVLQKDFAGCGVFAFEAMNYFREQHLALDAWMQSIVDGSDGNHYEADDEYSASDMENQPGTDQRDSAMPLNESNDDRVSEYKVPLQQLKPELLKIYDGRITPSHPDQPRLSKAQLDTVIEGDNTTLFDHLWNFEREVLSADGKTTTTVNTGSLVTRYRLLDEFQQIKEEEQAEKKRKEAEAMELTMSQASGSGHSRKRKRKKSHTKSEMYPCPKNIVHSMCPQKINQWLTDNNDKPFSKKEWNRVLQCNACLDSDTPGENLQRTDAGAYEWCIKYLAKIPSKPKRALLHSWFAKGYSDQQPIQVKKKKLSNPL